MTRTPLVVVVVALALAGTSRAAGGEWLSLCGKCLSPTIMKKSGIGTANAIAEGQIMRADAEAWCQNWEPETPRADCVRAQFTPEDAKKVFRATADCTAGHITAIDGYTYTQAGVWSDDVGKGRSRWRDASGAIVGQDNASNGLAISQQWEVLCPDARPIDTTPVARKSAEPAATFAVGDVVEAQYGRNWMRGRVMRVRPGPNGAEYDVVLDDGQRGILPARMIRKPAR